MAITKIPPAGLEDTGVGAGTVGSASQIPIITVNAQGQVTAKGTAALDLSVKVSKTGDSMSGNLTMTAGANVVSSRPGDDARNTGFKMADGQDLGEMNRSNQYYDDRVSNCNGYISNGNCSGNAQWTPPNGNWWEWYSGRASQGAWTNNGAFDGAGGTTYTAGTGLTLAGTVFSITNTAVAAGSYGSASSVGTFTVNAQGQLTAAADAPIAIAGSQITSGTIGSAYLTGS